MLNSFNRNCVLIHWLFSLLLVVDQYGWKTFFVSGLEVTGRRIHVGQKSVVVGELGLEALRIYDTSKEDNRATAQGDIFGLRVSQTAPVFLDYLLSTIPLKNQRICDLSSGTGILGMGLAARGAYATLTDPETPIILDNGDHSTTLEFLQANVDRNPQLKGRALTAPLAWGDQEAARDLKMQHNFDLVVASDVLYNTESHLALAQTLSALASPVLIAVRFRLDNNLEDSFFDLLLHNDDEEASILPFSLLSKVQLPQDQISNTWVYHLEPSVVTKKISL